MTLIESINRARELAGMKLLSEAQANTIKESDDALFIVRESKISDEDFKTIDRDAGHED